MTRCWHITIATVTRQTAFRTAVQQREAARRLARIAGDRLALFGVVDNHLHLVLLILRALAGRVVQRVNCSLSHLTGLRLAEANYEPVERRSHLQHLVTYVLTQPERHDLPYHPALWAGSCFQDLVGARWIPGLQLRIGEELPRLRASDLLRVVGLPDRPLQPAGPEVLRQIGLDRIAAAAGAALGLPTSRIQGRQPLHLLARRVVVALAYEAGFGRAAVSQAFGCSPRTITREASLPSDARALRATRLRIALEQDVAACAAARTTTDRPLLTPSVPPIHGDLAH